MMNSLKENSESPRHYQKSELQIERELYEKKQTWKSVIISVVATIILFGVIIFTLYHSEGWAIVQRTFFSYDDFVASLPMVASGLLTNLKVLGFAVVGTAFFSLLLALIKTTKSPVLFPVRFLAIAYTDLMRGIPIIVLLYLIGFGIPGLGLTDERIDPVILGTVALIMGYSAYVCEVIRSGIEAIHPSQTASARSLGLTYGQTLRIVVLPQAIRKVSHILINDFVALEKDAGLVSVLGIIDAVRQAGIYTAKTFNYTSYVVVALLFILISIPFIIWNDHYQKKLRIREFAQGGQF